MNFAIGPYCPWPRDVWDDTCIHPPGSAGIIAELRNERGRQAHANMSPHAHSDVGSFPVNSRVQSDGVLQAGRSDTDRQGLSLHAPAMGKFLAEMAGKDGCWEWPKFCDKNGYGRTKLNGKTTVATRVAWQLTRAPIPVGLFVLHECDNPPCCRPSHLFLGTQKDNCQDAKSKDRHSRGTRNGIAKLSDDAVRDIRTSKLTQWELARKYGVWQAAIWQVIHRKRWQHVQD